MNPASGLPSLRLVQHQGSEDGPAGRNVSASSKAKSCAATPIGVARSGWLAPWKPNPKNWSFLKTLFQQEQWLKVLTIGLRHLSTSSKVRRINRTGHPALEVHPRLSPYLLQPIILVKPKERAPTSNPKGIPPREWKEGKELSHKSIN